MNEHLCEPKAKSHSSGKDFGSLMAKKTSLYREWDIFLMSVISIRRLRSA